LVSTPDSLFANQVFSPPHWVSDTIVTPSFAIKANV
jgi:hypothetical protein